jgi:hypothetical protein
MVSNIEDMQQFGKDNMDAAMKSFGALSKSVQAIAIEMADYSKKLFEQGTATAEKLIGAKSLEKAIEVQSDYAKSSYESFVAEATTPTSPKRPTSRSKISSARPLRQNSLGAIRD